MDKFFEIVSQFTSLSEDSKRAFSTILKKLELPKGRTLIHANTICENAYFIEQGLARTYYYKNGKDVTDWLAAENSFVVSIESFGRLLVSHGLILVQQRFDDLHFASALERYKKMLQQNPSFIQRVPLSMIASYLGILQETLSRIRSKISF